MRTLVKSRALVVSSIAILIFSVVIGGIIYYFASNAIISNISESLTQIAVMGAKAVANDLRGSLEVIETIAAEESIKNPYISMEEKIQILKNEVDRQGFARMSIADLEGNSLTTDGNSLYVGDRDYFKLAREGTANVSDPIISRVDNTLIITFAAPIINDGNIIGVLYSTLDVEFLSKITDEIRLGEHGRSYIIDSMGVTIAHEIREHVKNRVNILLDWQKLGLHKSMYEYFVYMHNNEKGAGQYIFDSIKRYGGYAKIPGTNWYFGISAPSYQVFRSINKVYSFIGVLLLLIILIFSASQFYIRILRKNLKIERNAATAAIDTANLVILGIDELGFIHEYNKHAEIKLGYSRDQVVGNMKLLDIVASDSIESYDVLMHHINKREQLNSLELSLKSSDGGVVYLVCNLNILEDYDNEYIEIIGIDISERIKMERELIESHQELTSLYEELYASEETLREQYDELAQKEKKIHNLAYYDPLTGLANRINLESHFNDNIFNKQSKSAMLYMDIDNFKFVNDTFGHYIGDKLLIAVAENIKKVVGDYHVAGRLGGDEFMVITYAYDDISEIGMLADKLLKTFETGFFIEDSTISITTSIGIALYPEDGENFNDLLKCADIAMYAAKAAGKGSYVYFDDYMNESIVKKMKIQSSMKNAIENNEFLLYYQPQYHIESGRIKGFEALLRWNSSEHGFVSPADFIAIAETSGLIIPLGEWVLREACEFIKNLHDMGHKDICISVNVSVIQLKQENFVTMVDSILKEKGLKPSSLELEITESLLIENIELNMKKIKELRDLGVRISLDDFGTGYSSLTYLRELPIDVLKIDKSFIDNIMNDNDKSCLTGTIISLAHDLGLEVVAEGVEEEHQLKYLKCYNCDMVQGYLFSKPLPGKDAVNLLIS